MLPQITNSLDLVITCIMNGMHEAILTEFFFFFNPELVSNHFTCIYSSVTLVKLLNLCELQVPQMFIVN